MKPKNAEAADRVRITMQYRTARGMAYDLRDAVTRVTVLISESTAEGSPGAWEVEAKTAVEGEEARAFGPTRTEALRSVAALWAERHLPKFDWEAAVAALDLVRAL